jgi:cation transport ATPase
MISGEPIPVDKKQDDAVAGTITAINLVMVAEKIGSETSPQIKINGHRC